MDNYLEARWRVFDAVRPLDDIMLRLNIAAINADGVVFCNEGADSAEPTPDGVPFRIEPEDTMLSLGNRNYSVGGQTQVVERNEDAVLTAFFREAENKTGWIGLDQRTLRDKSGYDTAPRILGAVKSKYPILAPAIDCPGNTRQPARQRTHVLGNKIEPKAGVPQFDLGIIRCVDRQRQFLGHGVLA